MKGKDWVKSIRERIQTFGIKEWGMLLLVGICFLVIVLPEKNGGEEEPGKTENSGQVLQYSKESEENGKTYTELMERRVEELLSNVEHVGKVKVMITVSSTEEKNVLKDGSRELTETTETDSAGGSRVSQEESSDMETVFSGESPYLLSESYPEVIGVVVIAEGSGTGSVDYDILNAVQVLFNIPAHKIKIMKMK